MLKNKVSKKIKKIVNNKKFYQNPYFYLYDKSSVINQLNKFSKYADNYSLYYSMKANPHKEILKIIKSQKYCKGVEIASHGEMLKALEVFSPKEIIYTGPGKTKFELEQAIKKGIRLINAESMLEIKRINKISKQLKKTTKILVRINTDFYFQNVNTNMTGISTKLGIDQNKSFQIIKNVINNFENIEIEGIHVHAASGIINFQDLINYTEFIVKLVKDIEKETQKKFKIIDFGGGIGFDLLDLGKDFDIKQFFKIFNRICKKNLKGVESIFELGRYLVAPSGFYCSQIVDIKECKGKKHIILAGGINHLKRPSVSQEYQKIEVLKMERFWEGDTFVNNEFADVSGPLCFAEDIIYPNVYIKRAKVGDIAIVKNSGAYGLSGSSIELLSHPRPKEYFIK